MFSWFLKEEKKIHMAFPIENLLLKARKLILKLEKVSTEDFAGAVLISMI